MTETPVLATVILQQLQWRYATKKFDPNRKIPAVLWQTLLQSLVLAPSSFGLQPWKFYVIETPELRQALLPHTWNQRQVVDASHLVVFAIKSHLNAADVDRYLARQAEVRQTSVEELQGYGDLVKGFLQSPPYPLNVDEWSARQVYIALGQFMVTAALLGIDTCPMEGFLPQEYDRLLNLPAQGYHAVVVCAAGYRAADDQYATSPKVRYPLEAVVEVR
ncbi:bifunctional oxygen-insensitive NAD(P)H nitroreductase / dihydropteridine reductase [Thermosynechococcus sp. NK55a]|jgi:nitroreductase|uniref:NAD(P)H-dependent oxidoreductase n=1 Tax=unclassified Thermosynechococcus TaxID=2622553 RepID=UPI0003D84027|nr:MULTISPECIES: NAD(P)H-dependent oxidoreductase [unclassified Thermosynechococcus]AHB88817.1 bifunctional oxygen-insensitive NAD(P)H nitroreductase / dihydropteridine reductase [Thermosynechococcus sp. NK55a]RMH66286.1 MAG: NAD(P)H-dependent oxidoreductase [Cyanobacteria bacterium J003]HIK23694.1 NAD(P)H-dependent oxidoreductase [Thermosynechococcus sp. M3746_W2019_013]